MSDVRLCAVAGCYEATVGVGYWQGRQGGMQNPKPPRPRTHCRPHLLALIEPELVTVEVIGEYPIVDARTGKSFGKGHQVALDPVETHIVLLVASGMVKVLDWPE